MTRHFRPSKSDCLEIAGTQHRLAEADKTGSTWFPLEDSSVRLAFTGDQFVELLSRPDVRLQRGFFTEQSAFRRLRCDYQYLQGLTETVRLKLLWQMTCVRCFLEAESRGEVSRSEAASEAVLRLIEQRVNAIEESGQDLGRKPRAGQLFTRYRFPCWRSLMEWVRRYEGGGRSPLVFLRKRCPDISCGKLMAEAERLLAGGVAEYLDPNRPTQTAIVERVRNIFAEANAGRSELGLPVLPLPSERTIRRRIKALDPFEVVAQRDGVEAARRRFGFYEDGILADYPLQRVEMDEWQIDLASLLAESGALDGLPTEERIKFEVGRRWIYAAIDCATRCVLGFRIVETPNAEDAIRTLNLIIQDKTPIAEAAGCQTPWDQSGGVGVLVTDQGPAFASEKFRAAVIELGTTYEAPPAGVPKLRARVERLFRTFGIQLAPMLIGRTFSNPTERGDYPSEQWAALTDDDLAQVFTLFIVDIYHNTPHAGLRGETPANAWKRLSAEQGVTPPPDANHRRAVFGIPVTRKLDRHGVLFFGIRYTCPRLQEALVRGMHGNIPLRIDPEDLTHISVCLGHEWVSAEAVQREVWGLSLDEWQRLLRDLRTRFKAEAVLSEEVIRAARKKIRACDARARQLRRVQPPHLSAEELDRQEGRLCLGLRIGSETSAATGDLENPKGRKRPDPDDLLGDVIEPPKPVGPPSGTLADLPTPQTPTDDEEWSFDE